MKEIKNHNKPMMQHGHLRIITFREPTKPSDSVKK